MWFLICFTILASGASSAESEETLAVVEITGFSSLEGLVRLAIFNSPEGWPEGIEYSSRRISSAVTADTVTMWIRGLETGNYAMAAFHDRDSDSVFDRNLFGFPTEAYGFSNNVRGSMGPPDFNEAVFALQSDTVRMVIVLE
ncbi:MAG: DUF2141 domain-containing protein [Candidatus Aegiribacteria sp.]|nr:DUF2141 domain-containing protein [Candidatus Aegiribacteria sp.]